MSVNALASFLITSCVVLCESIAGSAGSASSVDRSEEEYITSITRQDDTSHSPYYPQTVTDLRNVQYWSSQTKSYASDDVLTPVVFSRSDSFVIDGTAATNTFDNTARDPGSIHLKLSPRDCKDRSQTHRVRGRKGSILVTAILVIQHKEKIPFICDIELAVPSRMVSHVEVSVTKGTLGSSRTKLLDEDGNTMFESYTHHLPPKFVTYSRVIKLHVVVSKLKESVEVLFNFTAVPDTFRSELYINFTSPTAGFVETANWNSDKMFLPFTKSSVHLTAPDNHMIVIYLEILDGVCDVFEISHRHVTLRSQNNTMTFWICKLLKNSCFARAFYAGKVGVTYQGLEWSKNRYFKIRFYFYPISQPPAQLSADRWSCATVNWRDVKPPWSCVFMFGCSSDEDGVGCWHDDGDGNLQQGLIQVDGRCFAVSRAYGNQKVSWIQENEWCQQNGGQMARLCTRRLLTSLRPILHRLGFGCDFILGLRGTSLSSPLMYRNSVLWSDDTVAHFVNFKTRTGHKRCVGIDGFLPSEELPLSLVGCETTQYISYHLCETSHRLLKYRIPMPPVFSTPRFSKPAYIQCPDNHFTHVFLACDEISHCWLTNNGGTSLCAPPLKSLPLLFECAGTQQSVPYTLVCNHREDCRDGSDESFCYFPPCDVMSPFECEDKRMNGDGYADEKECLSGESLFLPMNFITAEAYILNFSQRNFMLDKYTPPTSNTSATSFCPDTHFLCVSLQELCLPVYLRCNGMYDCPGHEDEAACDSYTCPGFYRCRGSQVCVHESHLCDGVYQCSQHDDELLCNETCPQRCVCHGWAFICSDSIHGSSYSNLRYLDASETQMTLADVDNHTYLVYLSLVRCNLTTLHEALLQNLRILDLSSNKLTLLSAGHFSGLKNLHTLKMSDNYLKVFSLNGYLHKSFLKHLDISNNHIAEIDFGVFDFFSSVKTLNLSTTRLNHVTGQGFPKPSDLRVIDLRFCPITTFPRGIFSALGRLETVYADSYKLCCPATLPKGFNVHNCHAPSDEVSSCDDLLRSNLYRIGLAIFASLALAGNVSSLLYRLIFQRTSRQAGYIFVTNLCLADLLMGVYLLMIGVADQIYKGAYLWEDVGWRNSFFCKMAGFICLLSSEVSVFIIFLITVDRFLVLRFPFNHLHFEKRSAQFACTISWLAGLVLAVIPLLPMTSHWQFYNQSSICIPLPTTRTDFLGRGYSYGVKVLLNFILFVCIFIGQIFIYWSVQANSISAACTSKESKEFNVARRLMTVAVLNVLCVFPVCFLGFLTSNHEVRIYGEVNIGIAIFVMPLNSALNPFLYTVNIYLQRRRRAREEKRRKYLLAQLKLANRVTGDATTKVKMTRRDALDYIRTLLSIKALSPGDLTRISQEKSQAQ